MTTHTLKQAHFTLPSSLLRALALLLFCLSVGVVLMITSEPSMGLVFWLVGLVGFVSHMLLTREHHLSARRDL